MPVESTEKRTVSENLSSVSGTRISGILLIVPTPRPRKEVSQDPSSSSLEKILKFPLLPFRLSPHTL